MTESIQGVCVCVCTKVSGIIVTAERNLRHI